MKINYISIKDVSCIRNISIPFNDHINFICGSNGIGKSSVLEAIAGFFNGPYSNGKLKKRFSVEYGECTASFSYSNMEREFSYVVKSFLPGEQYSPNLGELHNLVGEVIYIRTARELEYKSLSSISLQNQVKGYNIQNDLMNGLSGDNIKNWFIHRELFSKQDKALSSAQLSNLKLAKDIFSIIDDKFIYSHLDANTHDIIIKTPSGEICFEYLSSGFKSCLYLLLGLIKEIEYRFPSENIKAVDFGGMILIDEPEIHLHPAWQTKISKILTASFPCAQFICATHSPHIIQDSNKDEIITLEYDVDGENIKLKNLLGVDSGFQGWTIEEILSDVMGMNDVRSEHYNNLKNNFYKAIEYDDVVSAKKYFNLLNKILHPNNIERRVIKMDMACLSGDDK
ncbi:AAA family ATPase [Salmonella enterica subsp. enterica serovar Mississippi]|nr:AAA family ATPase [Salmonella enterica subsp. enterica serovar Mississippi]